MLRLLLYTCGIDAFRCVCSTGRLQALESLLTPWLEDAVVSIADPNIHEPPTSMTFTREAPSLRVVSRSASCIELPLRLTSASDEEAFEDHGTPYRPLLIICAPGSCVHSLVSDQFISIGPNVRKTTLRTRWERFQLLQNDLRRWGSAHRSRILKEITMFATISRQWCAWVRQARKKKVHHRGFEERRQNFDKTFDFDLTSLDLAKNPPEHRVLNA